MPISIFGFECGIDVNQIIIAGTAEQTSTVRIISHTAVIFSAIRYHICIGHISFNSFLVIHNGITSFS